MISRFLRSGTLTEAMCARTGVALSPEPLLQSNVCRVDCGQPRNQAVAVILATHAKIRIEE
jgi:hypothetical protein